MKTKLFIAAVAVQLAIPAACAQAFSSGSTGADGPLNVTASTTLTTPPDGVFNFTTITIENGATLRFTRNALNTPIYLLATGDVRIAGNNGKIDVSGDSYSGKMAGSGGPGGFDGGYGGYQGFPSGDGQGPGGGKTTPGFMWHGVYAFTASQNTNYYGNTLLSPLIGGSGGAGWLDLAGNSGDGGGGGGGAILIASSTRISIYGQIVSNGGSGHGGGGSGGAIRVVAPIVEGDGRLVVDGGVGENGRIASRGRTRIDSADRFSHRYLNLGGKGTRGSQMSVFPPGNPRLNVIRAAGQDIPEDAAAPVTVTLPVDANPNQIIRVQARGFTNDIPIRVRITPENAPSAVFDGLIQLSSGNPPFADVQVTLPLETVCHVHAWTR